MPAQPPAGRGGILLRKHGTSQPDTSGTYNVSADVLTSGGKKLIVLNATLNVDPPVTLPQAEYVPIPHPINTSVDVAVYYYPGWPARAKWSPVRYADPKRKPLLGYYDETNPEAIDWEIKWYVENGVQMYHFRLCMTCKVTNSTTTGSKLIKIPAIAI